MKGREMIVLSMKEQSILLVEIPPPPAAKQLKIVWKKLLLLLWLYFDTPRRYGIISFTLQKN